MARFLYVYLHGEAQLYSHSLAWAEIIVMALIETDALIIGAGPCGLFAIFELGMLDIRCHIIDALNQPGGQCAELYPEKPIYDIPAVPSITGQQLTASLMKQVEPFEPCFHFNTKAHSLSDHGDGRWKLTTDQGDSFIASVVVIAAGGGCFEPRKVALRGIDRFHGTQLHYAVRDPERFKGRRLVIAGGGDSALDWTLGLAGIAAELTLVHRRPDFRAAPASVKKVRELIDSGRIHFQAGHLSGYSGEAHLSSIKLDNGTNQVELACDDVLAFYGLTAQPGGLSGFGVAMEGGRVIVDPERFGTNLSGVYAIGDIAVYPGKLKLILSGFHEAALMAHHAKTLVHPAARNTFQHSTTALKHILKTEA
ncbi:NAD(P)/FAD-dependent oxidoreductase [Pseudomonas profundi]|uniref:NAD(P)/FAD-dependent oxidoreductase n=1 Tax=Pseudomonas profundi TaxID=1981513 RepID=UPI00123A4FC5|nr:NAD(P)/FAD-dependent oxidoreductase [Pseudomonas profundi]